MKDLTRVLKQEPRIAYALVFGSAARATMHEGSDLDVAIGLRQGTALDLRELGALVADLERVTARSVDLVILDDAAGARVPGLS